jgi:hypothetical protein
MKKEIKQGPPKGGKNMEKQEEIIAYRVGDHFLCPKHYELSAKILKVHDIELPAQPIKKGEIETFVCRQCKDTADEKGAVVGLPSKRMIEPMRKTLGKRESINLLALQDIVEDCGTKISFVSDFFLQAPPDREPEFSQTSVSGLALILDEIRDDLDFVVNEMSERVRKGLIIERAEQS